MREEYLDFMVDAQPGGTGTSRPSRVGTPRSPKTTRPTDKNKELRKDELTNAIVEAKKLGISVSKYLNTIITIRRQEAAEKMTLPE